MIRVGIIGCGKVADKHASQIQRVKGAEIVGICDQEELMAAQLAERFRIKDYFSDIQEMLRSCGPEVVHITTPPRSHYAIAKLCLERGCHVYVEKPFTINFEEAKELIDISKKSGQKITVGHETQFMPVARDMRSLIRKGFLGGPPIHMESIYCYDFSDERYAKALLGDANHWIRQLPGGLLQNIISHGIGKIVEYLGDDNVTVLARGFTSAFLKKIGEKGILDEARVIILDPHGTTAYFTFSSQIGPALHEFRIYGPRNSLIADHEHQTLIQIVNRSYKSYLNQFIPPFLYGKQHFGNGYRNIRRFLHNEFHAESAIHFLISSFYKALEDNSPLPISYRDILMSSRIIDEVLNQVRSGLYSNHRL